MGKELLYVNVYNICTWKPISIQFKMVSLILIVTSTPSCLYFQSDYFLRIPRLFHSTFQCKNSVTLETPSFLTPQCDIHQLHLREFSVKMSLECSHFYLSSQSSSEYKLPQTPGLTPCTHSLLPSATRRVLLQSQSDYDIKVLMASDFSSKKEHILKLAPVRAAPSLPSLSHITLLVTAY